MKVTRRLSAIGIGQKLTGDKWAQRQSDDQQTNDKENRYNDRPGVIERAFQIAKSGVVTDLAQLRNQLSAEGYPSVAQHLAGRSLSKQLALLIASARTPRIL